MAPLHNEDQAQAGVRPPWLAASDDGFQSARIELIRPYGVGLERPIPEAEIRWRIPLTYGLIC